MKNRMMINTDKYRLTQRAINIINEKYRPLVTPDYIGYLIPFPELKAILAIDVGVTGSWYMFPADIKKRCSKHKQKKYLKFLLKYDIIEEFIEEPFEEYRSQITLNFKKAQILPPSCKLDLMELEKEFIGDDDINELEGLLK